ncbi:glycosyltransferase family 2 protein [Wolfiporia cocos MD-104 SS10]|uniref:Glycosyltransferase family 2 protein n=1 Tax=Wolfiporia cocos (strain MD-104) TaxID=742152 RepID=A0A2H3JZG5_WOLCO|nr:glycosyltransferase family 2 protein [Wolfiporia cocos MD-104 SS10]
MLTSNDILLVTGGYGFIGGHVARALHDRGHRVRITDIRARTYMELPSAIEVMIGNLCDAAFCARAVHGATAVLHFAATMGGMGVIHGDNDFIIYQENHNMTLNLLSASITANVQRFLFASSACVYPDSLQHSGDEDVSLKEQHVWAELPPRPQGLYGLEKLMTEQILNQFSGRKLEIRIARFHNIYGPGGSWRDGYEKAPAALLRKACAAKILQSSPLNIEIWGDGTQRRSFCYITDAVEGILRLLESDCRDPVNIGSDHAVCIRQLADLAVQSVGLDPAGVRYQYVRDRPLGVGSRNSNNEFVERQLQWSPLVTLADGMHRTGQWIATEMVKATSGLRDAERQAALEKMLESQLVKLKSAGRTFAILLPITVQQARGHSPVSRVFTDVATDEGVPFGFGCVAFTDTSFPGMPTFPILHRTHLDIFGGEVIPDCFINQDGDPFLFQLYRRFGCSHMITPRISNTVGGSEGARYEKIPVSGWTFRPLDTATSHIETWLRLHCPGAKRKLTVDIIIPCYRVNLSYIDAFLALKPSTTCTTMFIVIVDDPNSPSISELLRKYAHRPDVRIRINRQNSGASASRNRGLKESSAEWVIFLDDDVTPREDVLVQTEMAIRSQPDAAGFVGNTLFPVADTVATAAIHLAGVTYFWDIAGKRASDTDLPWGVTANLIARRNVEDGVEYDRNFPKTGGGEDIDYCRKKRDFSLAHGGKGFCAAPNIVVTHPWWNHKRRYYWRFYMWSKGDGALIRLYPQYTYRQSAPNGAELLVMCALVTTAGCLCSLARCSIPELLFSIALGWRVVLAVFIANMLHDLYRHLWRDASRLREINMSVTGVALVAAVMESTLIRLFSEYGRLVGMVERREFRLIGTSFDWFTGRAGDGPKKDENRNRLQRIEIWLVLVAVAFFTLRSQDDQRIRVS